MRTLLPFRKEADRAQAIECFLTQDCPQTSRTQWEVPLGECPLLLPALSVAFTPGVG